MEQRPLNAPDHVDLAQEDTPISILVAEVQHLRDEIRNLTTLVNLGRRKYDLDGAADRLGVSSRTVRRRIEAGELAASREGGRVFVTETAIRDYEDSCRRAA